MPEIVASGTTQMAIDTWLLDQLIAGLQPPTLRVYRWQPAAISLGYHQKNWPEHWQYQVWHGQAVELVRRPTGGRAVLHQGDLTYAVTMPLLNVRRQDLYQCVCSALIAAWQRLDVSLSYGSAGRGYHHQPNCFAVATSADLVTQTGYKLIGNAQLRRDRSLLQHGTMRLWPDAELCYKVFGKSIDTALLPANLPKQPSAQWLGEFTRILVQEFETALGIVFEEIPLTDREQQLALDTYAQQTIP